MRAEGKLRRVGAGASREPGPGGPRKRQTFTGRPSEGEEVVFLLLLFLLILFPQLLPRPSSRPPPVWEPPGFSARTMHGLRKWGWLLGEAPGRSGARSPRGPAGCVRSEGARRALKLCTERGDPAPRDGAMTRSAAEELGAENVTMIIDTWVLQQNFPSLFTDPNLLSLRPTETAEYPNT